MKLEAEIKKSWRDDKTPVLTIACIAYNHEKYIARCIEGFLVQETDFPFEIIIHDDASTDNTQNIIREYKEKYPNIIKPILQTENHWIGKGISATVTVVWPSCRGKYIAWCEGDDYWTDPFKLQKQVTFLEQNPDYSICFHRVYELIDDSQLIKSLLNQEEEEKTFTIEYLAGYNFIHTPSVVFRNNFSETLPNWLSKSPVGDYPLHLLNARKGLIKYYPECMAVYRKHSASTWSSLSAQKTFEKWHLLLNLLLKEEFPNKVKEILMEHRRAVDTDYLKIIFEDDYNKFLSIMETYSANDPELARQWLLKHYPDYIRRIKLSRSYKLSLKLSSFKEKVFRSFR
jgi:glycosyltransferase involved in cell wall biosynthesis